MGNIKIPSMTHLLGNTKKRRAIRKLYEVTKDLAEQGGEYSFYTKPSGGIPYADLEYDVRRLIDYGSNFNTRMNQRFFAQNPIITSPQLATVTINNVNTNYAYVNNTDLMQGLNEHFINITINGNYNISGVVINLPYIDFEIDYTRVRSFVLLLKFANFSNNSDIIVKIGRFKTSGSNYNLTEITSGQEYYLPVRYYENFPTTFKNGLYEFSFLFTGGSWICSCCKIVDTIS